jgi:deoxyribonuclease-4
LLDEAHLLIETGVFQYVELMPVPNTDVTPFLEYDFCYIIHVTTEQYGFNIADKEKKEANMKIIDECIRWADTLDARYVVLHPGFGSLDTALTFLESLDDRRILVENMPKVGLRNESMVGHTPLHISTLMGDTSGFCLDFGHAIKAAISEGREYKEYVREFMTLKPNMFHLSDGTLSNEKDEHLAVGSGDYDFSFLMKCIPPSAYATVEIGRHTDSLEEDVKSVEKLRQWG